MRQLPESPSAFLLCQPNGLWLSAVSLIASCRVYESALGEYHCRCEVGGLSNAEVELPGFEVSHELYLRGIP